MSERADPWIRWTTTGCMGLLALTAGTVSYLHMHTFVALRGQSGWIAALTPLLVNGTIVAAPTTWWRIPVPDGGAVAPPGSWPHVHRTMRTRVSRAPHRAPAQ
jgi:Protein of unknown function (DUF2637)